MVLEDLIPKFRNTPIVSSAERIFQSATDFIRGNPIVSTAAIGAGFTGLIATAAIVRAKRRKRKAAKRLTRKRTRKKVTRRRKKVTHRSPRHRGHKRVSFITAKGKRVNFLVRGQKRSPKHRNKSGKGKQKRFIKGSPEAKRFMAKLRKMKK